MLYLTLCTAVMFVYLSKLVGIWASILPGPNQPEKPNGLKNVGILMMLYAVPLLYSAPFVSTLVQVVIDESGDGFFSDNNIRTFVYALLIGALICAIDGAARTYQVFKTGKSSFWEVGKITILLLAAFVGLQSSIKHLTFFDTPSAGWANISVLREMELVPDMKGCDHYIALVRSVDTAQSEAVEYRCPKLLVLSRFSSEPFVPWPDFFDGTSIDLAEAMKEVTRQAEVLGEGEEGEAP